LNSTANLTTGEKEKNLHLTTRQRQELQLKCLSLLAKGLSIAEIAEVEGITMWHARQVLDRINQEARDSLLSNMVSERVPLQVEISLETNRLLIKKCMSIMYGSKDPRVQLQAAAQISSLTEKNNEILSSSSMIANAIKRVLVVHPSTPSLSEQEEEQEQENEDDKLTSTEVGLSEQATENLGNNGEEKGRDSLNQDTTATDTIAAEPIAHDEPSPEAQPTTQPRASQLLRKTSSMTSRHMVKANEDSD
jgi:hypothetical protein